MDEIKVSKCHLCKKPRETFHASTWGVGGHLLGCNTYLLCAACAGQGDQTVDRSTLSPCNEKHLKVKT